MYYTHIDRLHMHLDWLKEKMKLEINAKSSSKRKVQRGNVYICNLGRGIGSEQEKERPCVVIQNQDGNDMSPNTIVAPITHTKSKVNVVIPIETQYDANGNILLDGNVLLGNIVTVSKSRLGNEITELKPDEMKLIDDTILTTFGIEWKNDIINNLKKRVVDKDNFINTLKKEKRELNEKIKELESIINSKKEQNNKA